MSNSIAPNETYLRWKNAPTRTFLVSFGASIHAPGASPHRHDHYEVLLCTGGVCRFLLGQTLYNLIPGDVLLIDADLPHQCLNHTGNQPLQAITLHLDKHYLLQLGPPRSAFAARFCNGNPLLSPDEESRTLLFSLLQSLHQTQGSSSPDSLLVCDALLTLILTYLNHRAGQTPPPPADPEAKEDLLVAKVKQLIAVHHSEALSIDKIADTLFVNRYHLMRLFRQRTGLSIHQYLTQYRLNSALIKMQDGVPINSVPALCGFGDYSSFFRAFKAQYGMSPREYLAEHPARSAE